MALEAMSPRALLLECPNNPFDHPVLLWTMLSDELNPQALLPSTAAELARIPWEQLLQQHLHIQVPSSSITAERPSPDLMELIAWDLFMENRKYQATCETAEPGISNPILLIRHPAS